MMQNAKWMTVSSLAAAGTLGMACAAQGAAVLNFSNETVYGGDALVVTAVEQGNPANDYWRLAIGKSTHGSNEAGAIISFIDLTGPADSHDYTDAGLNGDGPYSDPEGLFRPSFGGGSFTLAAGTNGDTSYSWTRSGSDTNSDFTTTYTIHAPNVTGTLIEAQTAIDWTDTDNNLDRQEGWNLTAKLLGDESDSGNPAAGSDIWEIIASSPYDETTDTGFITVAVKDNADTAALNLDPDRTFTYRVNSGDLRNWTGDATANAVYNSPRGYQVSVAQILAGSGEGKAYVEAGDQFEMDSSLLVNIAVPEPASAAMLAVGALALLRRGRR